MSGCQVDDCDQPTTHRAWGDADEEFGYCGSQRPRQHELLACLDDVGRAVDTLHDRGVTAVTVDPYAEPADDDYPSIVRGEG